MKEILVLGGKLQPYGGIETHILHFCKSLPEKLASLDLFISSTSYLPASKAALIQKGITVHEFDCSSGIKGRWEYLRCLLQIRSERNRNKILYSHGTSGYAYLANKMLRPSTWIHHHHTDVLPETEFSSLYCKVLKSADWVIACTPEHSQLLENRFSRNGRTIFLPYCKAEPEIVGLPTVQPAKGAKLIFGYFGRLKQSKGVRTLIELAPWFCTNGMECRLHGDDCEGLLSNGLPSGISWNGAYDSTKEMDALLGKVDVLVLPSTFPEGLPIVVSEAISRGVPVVAYSSGGMRTLKDFHRGIIIVPPDVEAFKAGILEMKERLCEPGLSCGLVKKYQSELGNQKTLDWWTDLLSKV
jgi:glycosyltransferase involved in cell wall biosynthesis